MGQSKARWVDKIRKRNGRIVPFDKRKISAAIYKASSAISAPDSQLAEDLSEAVTIYLNHHFNGRVPSVEEIQDIVEKVLIRTGHDRMAKAYILYRHKRAELRRKTGRVALAEAEHLGWGGAATGGSSWLDVQVQTSSDDLTTWDRKRIVEVLVQEVGLDYRFAEAISIEVEQEVMFKKLSHVTTTLIRELVDGKLLEYGLQDATRLHGRLGLPLYDVAATMSGTGPFSDAVLTPHLTSAQIGGSVKRQFAFLKVLPRSVVEAHTRGDLHVRGLWGIDRCDTLRVGMGILAELLDHGQDDAPGAEWDEVQLLFRSMQPFVSKRFTLCVEKERDREVLFSEGKGREGLERDVALAFAQGDEDRPGLGLSLSWEAEEGREEINAFTEKVLRTSTRMKGTGSGWYPRSLALKFSRREEEDCMEWAWPSLEEMAREGCPIQLRAFRPDGEGDGGLELCLLRTSLNLPRLAFLSSAKGEPFFEGLDRLIELSWTGFKAKLKFLRETWSGRSGVGYGASVRRFLLERLHDGYLQIGVCGLDESVFSLHGGHVHDSEESMEVTQDIVSHLAEKCVRLAKEEQGSIRLASDGSVSAPRRFSRLDLDRFPREAARVARIDASTGGVSYTSGLRLGQEHVPDAGERMRLEAALSRPLVRDAVVRLGTETFLNEGKELVAGVLKAFPHVDTLVLVPE